MEIVVKGRKTEVRERYRKHVIDKLSKLEKLAGKVIAVDVEVSREHKARLADQCERVEITLRGRGPVIRAEACASDPYTALDMACGKLESRLRRAADRRRVHYGRHTPESVAAATALGDAPARRGSLNHGNVPVGVDGRMASPEALSGEALPGPGAAVGGAEAGETAEADVTGDASAVGTAAADGDEQYVSTAALGMCGGDRPLVVREKIHHAVPMDLDQALYEMELVGHEFFLFVDVASGKPSVVYRRRGYDYGVIRLEEESERQELLRGDESRYPESRQHDSHTPKQGSRDGTAPAPTRRARAAVSGT